MQFFKRLFNKIRVTTQIIRNFLSKAIDRFEAEPSFRLQLLAWSLFVMVVSGSILTASNLFRLVVPGLSYPFPHSENRQEIEYYTLSRYEPKIVKLNEKLAKTGDLEQDARSLSFVIRKPFPLVQGEARPSAAGFFFPAVDLAIQRFWFEGENLYIDVDSSALESEIKKHSGSVASSPDEKSANTAKIFQICLTLTLFENFDQVNRIVYLKDGHRFEMGYSVVKSNNMVALHQKTTQPFDYNTIYTR
ncbi:MAG: hypothetical protein H3C43_01320 [Leptonema sp. (in: Bacteria)]|nr:hypothetical protein [Leptonema sp. (in: bacteria)]